MVAKIINPKEFDEFVFFVLSGDTVSTISKIMVFVNSLDKMVSLENYLQNLLLTYMNKDEERIIRIFISILKPD